MRIIKAPRLAFGDVVGIVAPASAPPAPSAIERAAAAVEAMGFKPKLAPNVRKRLGYLAGTDKQRASDLMRMFTAPEVKAIFCVRGGYGSSRLLPFLDFETIRSHPKILVGYSDITSLHCALWARARLVSFHGPMLNSELIQPNLPDYTKRMLLRALMEPAPLGSIACAGGDARAIKVLAGGCARGRLLGGNLTLLAATLGTPDQPNLKGAILYFEDLDEAPYRIDRMLTQLLNAGMLQEVAGLAIGMHKNCGDPKAAMANEYRQNLEDVLRDRLLRLGVPALTGLPFGHELVNATLPFGVRATLDARTRDLLVEESGVL